MHYIGILNKCSSTTPSASIELHTLGTHSLTSNIEVLKSNDTLDFFKINMNAPEWLNHGIHVYPLHPTTVECSKTWNPLTWPRSTRSSEGWPWPSGKNCTSWRRLPTSRHGSWINSLGSFKLFWKIFVKLGNLPHLWGASKVFEIVVVENGTTSQMG